MTKEAEALKKIENRYKYSQSANKLPIDELLSKIDEEFAKLPKQNSEDEDLEKPDPKDDDDDFGNNEE